MRGAYDAGATEHPQIEVRKFFPDATNWEPVAIADCWLFDAEWRDFPFPAYFRKLESRGAA